ncbi:MAG: N-acetylmuramoyl-L-alanine amidase [Sodalis sp. (in: enterobacteria)]|uniref:N-acetylmuramoyl-L-alanine amidase n=1 Tax=Sodalis sp. (in: enterobacteria) TaxID=1898979 RepID=UPI0039E66076
MSRAIHRIIIHCAATPNGRVLGRDGENAAQVIDRWHRARGFHRDAPANDNGLSSIGYHWVIDADGQLLTGRDMEKVGAHVRGYNADSLGLCLVGTDQFTSTQCAVLRTQVLTLRLRWPEATLHGHNEFSNKLCPGFSVPRWVAGDFAPLSDHLCELIP